MALSYEDIGFRCGLEIHQRLSTKTKLFCSCPTAQPGGEPAGTLTRRLRATAGELGKTDPAAAFEAARGRTYCYDIFPKQSCLMEQDEEPPRELNPEALDAVLAACNALHARVLDEIHVMRKTVADGSAVSAFQRTALVGVNGKIDTSKGQVGIATVCLEEESCGIVEKTEGEGRYRLDRLGIPLIEIATDATIRDPAHAQETAQAIGMLLRSSPHVMRGIGTIRQDLNVSVAGGARTEIKGAQDLGLLSQLAENESRRQMELAGISAELARRGYKSVAFGKPHGVSHVFARAKPFLSEQLKKGAIALAAKLMFCRGLLGREIMPGHRFGSELADYARVQGVRGIVHSDENPSAYGLAIEDFKAVSDELSCIEEDAWVVVVAEESRAIRSLRSAFDRAYAGIPKETRRADGVISRFMRPLPGSARMYPETDVLPVVITKRRVKAAGTLESFGDRKDELVSLGLNEQMADKILRSPDALAFHSLLNKTKIEPKTLAWAFTDVKPALRREGVDALRLDEALELLSEEAITKAALPELLKLGAKEPSADLRKLAQAAGMGRIRGGELEKLAVSLGYDFAGIMKRYRLQVDPAELQGILKKRVQ